MSSMVWQWAPYTALLIVLAAAMVILALHILRLHTPRAKTATLVLLAIAEWALGYAMELGCVTLQAKTFWLKAQYLGIVTAPTAWFAYTLQYTGREKWLTRRNVILLSILPFATLLLALTNETHGLIWSRITLDTGASAMGLEHTFGVALWLYVVYAYTLLLLGAIALVQMFLHSRLFYRRQTLALLIGALAPWLGSVFDMSGLMSFDVTPLAYSVTGLSLAWSLLRLRLGTLIPVAYEAIVKGISDAMIVVDAQDRVVDLNPAAEQLFRRDASQAIGQPMKQVWAGWTTQPEHAGDESVVSQEVALGEGAERSVYDMRLSPLHDWRGRLVSRVVVLRDITKHKQTEQTLRESEERYRQSVENSPNPIFSVDREGKIQTWNQACEQFFQYNSEEAVGQAFHELLLSPGEQPAVESMLSQVWQGHSLSNQDMVYRSKDGSQRSTVSRLYPLLGRDDHVEECVLANTDITERKRAEAHAALIYEVSQRVSGELELDALLSEIVTAIRDAFDYHNVLLMLLDEQTQRLTLQSISGDYADVFPKDLWLALEEGMIGHAAASGETQLSGDVSQAPHYVRKMKEETKSELAVPIKSGQNVIGVLDLQSDEFGAFDESDVAIMETLSAQIAAAIENARLFKAEQRRRREAEALRKASLTLGSVLDVSLVLDQLLAQIVQVIPYDSANVISLEEDIARVTHWWGDEQFGTTEMVTGLCLRVDEMPHLHRMLTTRRPHIVSDTQVDAEWVHLESSFWARSWVGAPIVVWNEVLGFLSLNSQTPNAYSSEEAELLSAFAAHAALAIENALLVEGLEAQVLARTTEIRIEQQKSETILRNVGDAIIMTDMEGRIQYANDAFVTLTGYSAQEAIGRSADFLAVTEMPHLGWRSLPSDLTRREIWQVETTFQRKDGRTYEAAVTIAPMYDVEGQLVGSVLSHRDISRQKELEQARRQFITNISHELRTPVTNVKLYTHLLGKETSTDRSKNYLRVLEAQVTRLEHLIEDVIEITALDSGQAVTAWQVVSLPTIIQDAITRYQSQAEASRLTIEAALPTRDFPAVKGDQARLTQALDELVENAITFTPAGGQVTVELDTAQVEGQNWVTVAVQDTGPGISQEEQDHVFDRFFRGSLAESGHIPGPGLGLSIVQEIMHAHGGRVTVESETGQGSTFTLWLRPSSSEWPPSASSQGMRE